MRGTKGENRFGADPRTEEFDAEKIQLKERSFFHIMAFGIFIHFTILKAIFFIGDSEEVQQTQYENQTQPAAYQPAVQMPATPQVAAYDFELQKLEQDLAKAEANFVRADAEYTIAWSSQPKAIIDNDASEQKAEVEQLIQNCGKASKNVSDNITVQKTYVANFAAGVLDWQIFAIKSGKKWNSGNSSAPRNTQPTQTTAPSLPWTMNRLPWKTALP